MRTRAWASIKVHPNCVACGDAGAFLALLRTPPGGEFTFRCGCPAGVSHPARGILQWTAGHFRRYRRISAAEMTSPGLEAIKRQLRTAVLKEATLEGGFSGLGRAFAELGAVGKGGGGGAAQA